MFDRVGLEFGWNGAYSEHVRRSRRRVVAESTEQASDFLAARLFGRLARLHRSHSDIPRPFHPSIQGAMASAWIGRGGRPRFGGGRGLVAPSSLPVSRRYFGGGRKWEPPPTRALEPGERPKCVVVHCTPPRASKDARLLEEVCALGFGRMHCF